MTVVRLASPIFGTPRTCPETVRTAEFGERSTNGAPVRGVEQDLAPSGFWRERAHAEGRLEGPTVQNCPVIRGVTKIRGARFGEASVQTLSSTLTAVSEISKLFRGSLVSLAGRAHAEERFDGPFPRT